MTPARAPSPPRTMRNFADMLVIVPVAAVIVAAIALAAASMVESARLSPATGQILNLVAPAPDFSAREAKSPRRPGEARIAAVPQAGRVGTAAGEGPPAYLNNSWNGAVRAVAAAPSEMRVETDVPPRACRRLALFFAGSAAGLGVQI